MSQAAMDAITIAQEHIQRLGPFSAEAKAFIAQELLSECEHPGVVV
jgi:hypothetical protein